MQIAARPGKGPSKYQTVGEKGQEPVVRDERVVVVVLEKKLI